MTETGARVVLGISCDYHDAAAALLVGGELVAAAEEERFTRRKHDAALPALAVESCLRTAGIAAGEVDVVAFHEHPVLVLDRYLAAHRRQGPAGWWTFTRDAPTLIGRNLVVDHRVDRLLRRLGARRSPRFAHLGHHLSHAAAAYFPSPFDSAAVLTVDGIGEWTTASIGRGHGPHLRLVEETRYPNSLGLLYALATAYCGFRPNDGEYQIMGLAAFGDPVHADRLAADLGLDDDGSLHVDGRRVGWFRTGAVGGAAVRRLFGGAPRRPGEPLTAAHADVAASVQAVTERAMTAMARRAVATTGERRLVLAGGVALNSRAVGLLRTSGVADDVWVQPAAGDAGSSIGAALAWWHLVAGHGRAAPRGDAMRGAFLGPWADPGEVASWLTARGVPHTAHDDESSLADAVVDRLEAGAVVGWCRGRMELGPRALGHRSILADPRSTTVRARLNEQVKERAAFRPFAPAVLAEQAAAWFELDGPSPHMSFAVPVSPSRLLDVEEEPTDIDARAAVARSTIPACTHVDGTARVQTVDATTNPELHGLLSAFERRTGCPVLLNTSFNGGGEPIVASPADAWDTAQAIGLDVLVLERCVVDLRPVES